MEENELPTQEYDQLKKTILQKVSKNKQCESTTQKDDFIIQQDQQLDLLLKSIERQKEIALFIKEEVNCQNNIIDKMNEKVDITQVNLKKQETFLNKILKKFF